MLKRHLRLGMALWLVAPLAHAKPEPARTRHEAVPVTQPEARRAVALDSASRGAAIASGNELSDPTDAAPRRERSASEPREAGAPSAARASAAKTRARDKAREPPPPCFKNPVRLTRQLGSELEERELSLTFCDGKVNPGALDSLSVLARSRSVDRPDLYTIKAYQRLPLDKGPADKRRDPAYLAPQILRLHPGLLERLQRVVEHFPQRTIEVISGHRPEARDSSRHHHGRALDFRVAGVSRERLRDFLRSFEQTGVGYYPNSSFVHMDVRDDKGYWVDRSGPGEPADYGVWPPPKREIERTQARIIEGALADLAALAGDPLAALTPARSRPQVPGPAVELDASGVQRAAAAFEAASQRRPAARQPAPVLRSRAQAESEPSEPGDQLTPREIAKIRAEALKALAALQD